MDRIKLSWIVGHYQLRAHLYKVVNPIYRRWNKAEETAYHLLCDCEFPASHITLKPFVHEVSAKKLATFI